MKIAIVGIENGELLSFLTNYSWQPRVYVGVNPPDDWLLAENIHLYLLNGSLGTVYELTTRIGRIVDRPVIWYGLPDYVPDGFLDDLQYWPPWAVFPPDTPFLFLIGLGKQMLNQEKRLRDTEQSLVETKNKLLERKLIEQAKGILMEHFDISESEAYQRMRHTAMEKRKSVREIAQTIMMFSEMKSPHL